MPRETPKETVGQRKWIFAPCGGGGQGAEVGLLGPGVPAAQKSGRIPPTAPATDCKEHSASVIPEEHPADSP